MYKAILSLPVFLGIFVGALALAAPPSDNCAGLSGAAFGLCIAAQSVECDGTDSDSKACGQIETRYVEITGTEPPWVLPPCPCGSTLDFITRLKDYNYGQGDITCVVVQRSGENDEMSIHTKNLDDNLIFTRLPPLDLRLKHTCGFDNTSVYDVDDNQAQSCANNIQATAANLGVICTGP